MEFYDAHSPNAMYSLQMGAKGMSSISGNFYPEILVWMVNNATNPDKLEEVKWLQSEISRVDPLIHIAYPMSAKYFLRKRGLPVRTISRATALELTPDQKKILDEVHDSFRMWCERLDLKPVDAEALMLPKYRWMRRFDLCNCQGFIKSNFKTPHILRIHLHTFQRC